MGKSLVHTPEIANDLGQTHGNVLKSKIHLDKEKGLGT